MPPMLKDAPPAPIGPPADPPYPVITPSIPASVHRLCNGVRAAGPAWVSAAHADARAFAQLVISQAAAGDRVLDVGTGTGICAICLARLGHHVAATDLSGAAVRCARRNAARNGVRFDCYESDLLDSVGGRFDLIAFNLPYNFTRDTWLANLVKNLARRLPLVRHGSGAAMPGPVRRFHRRLVQRLLAQAPDHVTPTGIVLLHVFEAEVPALVDILPPASDVQILHHSDLAANRTVGLRIRLAGTD